MSAAARRLAGEPPLRTFFLKQTMQDHGSSSMSNNDARRKARRVRGPFPHGPRGNAIQAQISSPKRNARRHVTARACAGIRSMSHGHGEATSEAEGGRGEDNCRTETETRTGPQFTNDWAFGRRPPQHKPARRRCRPSRLRLLRGALASSGSEVSTRCPLHPYPRGAARSRPLLPSAEAVGGFNSWEGQVVGFWSALDPRPSPLRFAARIRLI